MQARSVKSIYKMKFDTYRLDGIWGKAIGEPETNGAWLIWGAEKNGKTTLALQLANYLTNIAPTWYVSGEEGVGANFLKVMQRAGIDHTSKLKVTDYVPLVELDQKLQARRAAKIVLLDNITIYHEELKYGAFAKLLKQHPDKLFIWLAHEEKGEPFTSSAKMCRRLAKVLIHVEGMTAQIGGRCPGGTIVINEEKAQLYWGQNITKEE